MKFLFIAIVLLLTSYSFGFSQVQEYPKKEKKVFLYSFENISSLFQPDSLAAEVLKVKGISEAKVKCKTESNKGQLTFTVEQIITGDENIENIDLASVKKIIQSYNLIPIECIIREPQK